jgi:putative transposase
MARSTVGSGWRMDETYIKVKGQWKYLYRALDREGQIIDFQLTAHRDKKAALRFLKNLSLNLDSPPLCMRVWGGLEIGSKKAVRPMLGFKSFRSASLTLRGIELMHMLKKGQLIAGNSHNLSAAGQFY